jgi:hypothetical protein
MPSLVHPCQFPIFFVLFLHSSCYLNNTIFNFADFPEKKTGLIQYRDFLKLVEISLTPSPQPLPSWGEGGLGQVSSFIPSPLMGERVRVRGKT